MISSLRGLACAALLLSGTGRCLHAADTAESPANAPSWLAAVPALNSEGPRAFQFRTNAQMPLCRFIIYASWAPPNRRAVIFCDARDGLPLVIAIDGDGWIYDLIGGQIVHFKLEPKFDLRANGGQLEFAWGVVQPGQAGGIHADLGSILKAPNITSLRSSADAARRTAAGRTDRGSKAVLETSATDPPLPTRFILSLQFDKMPGGIECDGFQFDAPLPPWHHSLDISKLIKDVPYLDATDMKGVPADREAQLAITKELMLGEATFLIRPAVHDPALRQKLEGTAAKLDFQQIELHEKLLKDAWLRALEHQHCEPAKSYPPPTPLEDSSSDTPGDGKPAK